LTSWETDTGEIGGRGSRIPASARFPLFPAGRCAEI
jgi:hypothetical protein